MKRYRVCIFQIQDTAVWLNIINQILNRMESNRNYQQDYEKVRTIAYVLGGLLFLCVVGLVFFAMKNKSLSDYSQLVNGDLSELEDVRATLLDQLQLTETDLENAIVENDSLSTNLTSKIAEVITLQDKLQKARTALAVSERENSDIQERLESLTLLRDELERDLTALRESSDQLHETNALIQEELVLAKQHTANIENQIKEMTDRNKALVERLYSIAPAGFIADNFMVRTEKKNDKLTSKAKQVDRLIVSFDINNVPELYREKESLFLVLTEFDGHPVAAVPTAKVNIHAREQLTVDAAAKKDLVLDEHQHLDMEIVPTENLSSGMYHLLVYADHGFLGATSVQLR